MIYVKPEVLEIAKAQKEILNGLKRYEGIDEVQLPRDGYIHVDEVVEESCHSVPAGMALLKKALPLAIASGKSDGKEESCHDIRKTRSDRAR